MWLFADDSSIFIKVRDVGETQSQLMDDLTVMTNWARQWKMEFNPDISKQAIEVIFSHNKTQYDWFPGKSQNSKKFSAKLKQLQQRLKIIGRFLTFWGVKIPPGGQNKFGGQITSKMNSAPSKYSVCRFSAKSNNF